MPAYLDHNATTPLRPGVAAAMAEALGEAGNPSSVHRAGRLARRRVESARERVAALVGGCSEEVVFTSGGTEANALALWGCGRARVLVSAVEHDSVLKAVPGVEAMPVDGQGRVDLAALGDLLQRNDTPAVVSVMMANNETGVLQPVAEVAAVAHRFGALVHCDASQAGGKMPVSLSDLDVDMLTLSAHKLGGPMGVGALVLAGPADLVPILQGGGQERGRRAGTENVPGIVGFGLAAELAADGLAGFARLGAWRDELERRCRALVPGAQVFGGAAERLANTSCLSLPGVGSEVQVMALDLAGVAVSAGSACSSGKVRASHVLRAMGVPQQDAACAIRVSLGWSSTAEDIEMFLAAWGALAARTAGERQGTTVTAA